MAIAHYAYHSILEMSGRKYLVSMLLTQSEGHIFTSLVRPLAKVFNIVEGLGVKSEFLNSEMFCDKKIRERGLVQLRNH